MQVPLVLPKTFGLTDMNAGYYCHFSTGKLLYDPGKGTKKFDPWWVILECDKGIVDFYIWLAARNGVVISKNLLWGSHISVVKGEEPPKKENWGKDFGEVRLWHTNIIRTDNGMHAWVDAWSEDLAKIRQELGLTDVKMSYHITLGRVVIDGRNCGDKRMEI